MKKNSSNSPLFKHGRFVLVLVLAQMGFAATQANAYDLATDYSATLNPTGVWSYGAQATPGGPFQLFNIHRASPSENGVLVDNWQFGLFEPTIWHNGTANTATSDGGQGIYPPGTVALFSAANGTPYGFGMARFTAPQAGSYQLSTTVHSYLNGPSSGDYDFHVLDNGVQSFGQFLPGNTGTSYSATLNLLAGETIDFAIGRGLDGNGNYSGAVIQASLTPVPEPGTFALASLGVAAMLAVRRRK